jgi:hypothetical protein
MMPTLFQRMAAGLVVLAAFSVQARADDSPIRFVSGPFAGAAAQETQHKQETLAEMSGTKTSDSAVFRAGGMVSFVYWARLSMDYRWQEGGVDLAALSSMVGHSFNATGISVIRGDRTTVNGFSAQYRLISLTGTNNRCGIFILKRAQHLISGFACDPTGRDVPVQAVMEGISIDHVIGP